MQGERKKTAADIQALLDKAMSYRGKYPASVVAEMGADGARKKAEAVEKRERKAQERLRLAQNQNPEVMTDAPRELPEIPNDSKRIIEKDPELDKRMLQWLEEPLSPPGENLVKFGISLAGKDGAAKAVEVWVPKQEVELLNGMKSGKSVAENLAGHAKVQAAIRNGTGVDDYMLLGLAMPGMWKELAEHTNFPLHAMADMAGVKITVPEGKVANPGAGHELRTLANKDCDTSGCGEWGAPRDEGKRKHMGVDISMPVGTPVISPVDGRAYRRKLTNGLPNTVIETKCRTKSYNLLYVEPRSDIIENGIPVKQGEVVGKTVDITDAYGKDVPQHLHIGIWENGAHQDPSRHMNFPNKPERKQGENQ